ncbi:CidA/LrgA family protein [uncultured Oscillibacter sp.]|uniref:CidA/LrgA family protein n=1 Tax=uncultured Oscillibacter sp. TaxID=876091 RepID=UPI0025E81132|nr:CidA/LrgA family protein [uncultured Oscillibacter sp.]
MRYISQFLRILAFCFLGEVLHSLLPLPIPASIYGLALLLAALRTGLVELEQVKETARFLIAVFPLLFVPGAAGIMELEALLAQIWLPAVLAVALVTVLVMAAAGWVTQAVIRRKGARHE